MSTYNFDFNFVKGGAPIVTLSAVGLAFNAGARSMLEYPASVEIGFDEHNNVIAVKKHDIESSNKAYQFESRVKANWIRISMRDFMKYLSLKTGIDFLSKAVQFIPERDKENPKMILIIVNKEHAKDKNEI
jgi:hypothetical protein